MNNTDPQLVNGAGEPLLAIVGLSCLFPKAASVEQFWNNIVQGVDAIEEIPSTHWDPNAYFDADPKAADMTYARQGGFLSPLPFDPLEFGISPNNLEAIDTSQLLGLVAAKRALDHAGYPKERQFDRSRISCIIGVTGTLELVVPLGARLGHPLWRKALREAGVDDQTAADVMARISDGYVGWQENSFPGLLGNVVAGRIANKLNLGGTNCVVDAACASSLSALHLAALELSSGRSDMVLTGGVDTFNDIFMFMCFSKTPALSPTGHARPFSKNADGTTLGEGLGVVVLKRLADAQRDGDQVYAVLRGLGSSSDGQGTAVYAPKKEGQIRCLTNAYQVAGVSPASVQLVEAHGTGTKVGDATEVAGLAEVFRQAGATPASCAVGSIKSQIGHTKAAAGVASLIKATLALHHRVLPPTIKVDEPAEVLADEASPLYVNTQPRPWFVRPGVTRRAGVSAFGFGGSNFHCVLDEAPKKERHANWRSDIQLFPFNANDRQGLEQQLEEFAKLARANSAVRSEAWRNAARQLREKFRSTAAVRLILVTSPTIDIEKQLASAKGLLEQPVKTMLASPDGVYLGTGTVPGKLAYLFPGQGSQYVGMFRNWACQFPTFHDQLAAANLAFEQFAPHGNQLLTDFIYPVNGWSAMARQVQQEALRRTEVAQPAIGAISLAALTLLNGFGIQAQMAGGHSYGELTALCASDRFDAATLYKLSMLRGTLMAETSAQSETGGMLAVQASAAVVQQALLEDMIDAVIANRNSPGQVVVSGRLSEIDRAASSLARRNLRGKMLAVAGAFHSPLVAAASQRFRPELERVSFVPGKIPIFANTSAEPYPDDAAAARELLAGQLAKPVNFEQQVRNMQRAGVHTFVEVGPSTVLTGLVSSILDGTEFKAVAIDASQGQKAGQHDLAQALAQIAVLGHAIDLTSWDRPHALSWAYQPAPAHAIPICGANYRKPVPPRAAKPAIAKPVSQDSASLPLSPVIQQAIVEPPSVEPALPQVAPVAAIVSSGNVSPPPVFESPITSVHSTSVSEPPRLNDQVSPELLRALEAARQNLTSLEQMLQTTADVHREFLEGQQAAIDLFERLANQEFAALTSFSDGLPPSISGQPASLPVAALSLPTPPPIPAVQTVPAAPVALSTQLAMEPLTPPPVVVGTIEAAAVVAAAPVPIAPATVAPTPQPTAAVPAAVTPLEVAVMAVVAEKTGYPAEMLTPAMTLDHDLGIDSIKRVEILSALQERLPHLPPVKPEDLGALQTLSDVAALLTAQSAASPVPHAVVKPIIHSVVAPSAMPVVADSVASAPAVSTPPFTRGSNSLMPDVLAVVAEKTGYPAEMLTPAMTLDHDLGIDSIKRVEILSALQERLPNLPAVKPEDLGTLQTLQDVADLLSASATSVSTLTGQTAVATTNVVQATVAPATLPTSAPAAANHAAVDQLQTEVLKVVAEKTGYPAEMLTPAMTLDHDLGIDSIKRVEILSAVQEQIPGLPAVEPEQLGSLQTLNDIVQLLAASVSNGQTKSPPVVPLPVATPVAAAPGFVSPTPMTTSLESGLTRGDVVWRNLPPLVDGAVTLPAGSEVWVTDDGGEFSFQLVREFSKAGFATRLVMLDTPESLEVPTSLAAIVIVSPVTGMGSSALWSALRWVQKLERAFRERGASRGAVLATVSRLDGQFGTAAGVRLTDPVSGGLAGLTKTVAREWPEVTCKSIDIAPLPAASQSALAARLAREVLTPGPLEVGLTASGRGTLDVALRPANAGQPPITPGDLVVVTGGARGVTAACVKLLAQQWKPTVLMLGRTPIDKAEPAELAAAQTEGEIKQVLARLSEPGTSPRMIDQRYRQIVAQRDILQTLSQLAGLGIKAEYRAANVRAPEELHQALSKATQLFGPVRGVIHGAGVLADGLIGTKTREQFEQVYETKVSGLMHLLGLVRKDQLRFIGLFSSFTGRYGRVGQVDYAMANEVLNKQAQQLSKELPGCRVVAFNWGPWDGGMVTPGLAKIFAQEGVELIPLAAGARQLVSDLAAGSTSSAEVVVLAGQLPAERGSTSIMPSAAVPSPKGQPDPFEIPADYRLVAERTISHGSLPCLRSHLLAGKGVVPMALFAEWLAFATLHANPGLELLDLSEVRTQKGVILATGQQVQLRLFVTRAKPVGHAFEVHARLYGHDGQRNVLHASAVVHLGNEPRRAPDAPAGVAQNKLAPWRHQPRAAYEQLLFHGSDFQSITSVIGCDATGIELRAKTAPAPLAWMTEPFRSQWTTDPLIIDTCFQAMILWSQDQRQSPVLPCYVGRYEQYHPGWPLGEVSIRGEIVGLTGQTLRANFFITDAQCRPVARLENCEATLDPSLKSAFVRI